MRYSYILFCSPIIPPSTESMPTSINTIYECVMRYTYNGSWNITLPKIQSKSTNKMRHYMHVCVLYQGWRYNCSIGALTSSFPHDLLQLTFNLYNLTYLTWPLTSFNWVALLLKNNNVHCILLHFCYTIFFPYGVLWWLGTNVIISVRNRSSEMTRIPARWPNLLTWSSGVWPKNAEC